MTAIDRSKRLTSQRVKTILAEWFAMRRPSAVEFKEESAPKNSPHEDDYSIVYESVFLPEALDQARVEIWVTDDGNVAIGFEKQDRIARRLGVKGGSDRFAAGHEPCAMTEAGLLSLLDRIADGEIAILATVLPLVGLTSTKAVVTDDNLKMLSSKGYTPIDWLSDISPAEFLNKDDLLRFRRW